MEMKKEEEEESNNSPYVSFRSYPIHVLTLGTNVRVNGDYDDADAKGISRSLLSTDLSTKHFITIQYIRKII